MKKIYLFIFCFLTFFYGFSQSQPIDNVIIAATPHVPVMQIFNGNGSKFPGSKFIYTKEENVASLKSWIANYPKEVPKYKKALKKLVSNTSLSSLNDEEVKMFDGFQAQYKMFKLIAAGKL